MRLIKITKSVLRRLLFGDGKKIVVASNGRAGSTMLFDAVTHSYIEDKFNVGGTSILGRMLVNIAGEYCDRLSDVSKINAVVIKTHALWNGQAEPGTKYLFVHGDPLDSALSVTGMVDKYGEAWFKEHLYHLESSGGELDELYQRDVLNYEKQIVSWSSAKDDAVLCVPYEKLWEVLPEISRHVGFDVKLPEYVQRPEKSAKIAVNQQLFEKLRSIRESAFNVNRVG